MSRSARKLLDDRTGRVQHRFETARCTVCAAWSLTEPLPPERIGEAYGGEYYSFQPFDPERFASSARLAALSARYGVRRGIWWQIVGRRLPGYPPAGTPGLVVDLGCGAGTRIARLSAAGWRTVGIEISSAAAIGGVAAGRAIVQATNERVPLRSCVADSVVISHALEHSASPDSVVREARRVLRPGGTLVITTPNATSIAQLLFGTNWVNWDAPRHFLVFGRRSLVQLVRNAGFEIRMIRGSSTGWSIQESIKATLCNHRSTSSPPFLAGLRAIATALAMVLNLTPWADELEVVARRPD